MTGFGKAVVQLPAKKITMEVKSLNSKQTDINMRMPTLFREKEGDLRQMVAEALQRGKIDVNFYCEITGVEEAPSINRELVAEYIRQLRDIAGEAGVQGDILNAVMNLPDVMQAADDSLSDSDWQALQDVAKDALIQLVEFRNIEGEKLEEDLRERLRAIETRMNNMQDHDKERMDRIREKMQRSLAELKESPDENRFEQELIYYLEKLDITEERVRLKSHLDYFHALLDEGGPIGKKLGFIGQEMGREINTMGSKANHAAMQKLVVEMKDELEKIKEQVLNIL
ncbi:MAG: YicC family protein [Owenweeksia sp.]|nr:YicC family protein [Owenweeksia sp.]MBF98629.1 YicC family protein [Owenweeksia sp.]HBF20972.1 YicC family protein [Cryomorphaceae bacterium]HCQ15464.1 YicC family protein [Cryomorphaceae bacterium]|tara:strand:+ start:2580 stop:3431 length:852 start_codon:yes stop_codon:yes gene_type:complete